MLCLCTYRCPQTTSEGQGKGGNQDAGVLFPYVILEGHYEIQEAEQLWLDPAGLLLMFCVKSFTWIKSFCVNDLACEPCVCHPLGLDQ